MKLNIRQSQFTSYQKGNMSKGFIFKPIQHFLDKVDQVSIQFCNPLSWLFYRIAVAIQIQMSNIKPFVANMHEKDRNYI